MFTAEYWIQYLWLCIKKIFNKNIDLKKEFKEYCDDNSTDGMSWG
jgi:hypothetical protein